MGRKGDTRRSRCDKCRHNDMIMLYTRHIGKCVYTLLTMFCVGFLLNATVTARRSHAVYGLEDRKSVRFGLVAGGRTLVVAGSLTSFERERHTLVSCAATGKRFQVKIFFVFKYCHYRRNANFSGGGGVSKLMIAPDGGAGS